LLVAQLAADRIEKQVFRLDLAVAAPVVVVNPPRGLRKGFNRDSPDDCRSAMNIRVFLALLQDGRELRTATDTSGIQNGGRVANLAIFAGIWTHSSRRLLVNA
jgi:hypothetical protein